jgi:hypothetical protein
MIQSQGRTDRRSMLLSGGAGIVAARLVGPAGAQPQPAQQPRPPAIADLARRTVERRAAEAAIWALPIVNFDAMLQAFLRDAKGGVNQLAYWSRPADWRNQTLTPNTDALYIMPFMNLKEAVPMVLEIPPADDGSIVGTIMTAWQEPLEDVGPAGMDKGRGGKYLILPPDHTGPVPDGFLPLRSNTLQAFALLRSIPRGGDEAGIARAVTYLKRIALYPLSAAASPRTRFVDAAGTLFDATIPYDPRFFEALHRIVQLEPWLERDRAMINTLASLGIRKGQPFAPDEATRAACTAGLADARAFLSLAWVSSCRLTAAAGVMARAGR